MDTVWTAERINMLGRLWGDGLSTAEIGRRLGLTKNAVIGKAHRLGLKGRPSPVRAVPKPARPVVIGFSGPSCSWPFGHPTDKDFHFCGARAVPGKPYCAEHSALAYVRPKGRESSAA